MPLSSSGLVAWKTNFSGPLSVSLFENIPVLRLSDRQVYFFSCCHAIKASRRRCTCG